MLLVSGDEKYILEYLAAWIILACFQSVYYLRTDPALALRWLVRTGLGVAASIIIVPAALMIFSIFHWASSVYITYICYCIFPFSVTGIVVGFLQSRLLKGRIAPLYLSAAWINSLIAGFVCGLIVSHFGSLDTEAGTLGPYFSTGLSIAILGGALVYFIITSTVLYIFWQK